MARRSNVLLAITLGSVVILFAALVAVMWRLGFFSFSGSDPSSKVVAAALALVGTFTGTVVSIVGTLLKYSIDQQTESRQQIDSDRNAALQRDAEQRLKMESDRNAALQRDAEQRLKLEAAVRALQLFSTSAGTPTPEVQRDGALFALDSLEQYELTLLLIGHLLGKNQLSPATAASLLDHPLLKGSEEVKVDAINLLIDHARHMVTPLGLALPRALEHWKPGLSDYVREWAPVAMAEVMMARPAEEWEDKKFSDHLWGLIAGFCLAWEEEPKDSRLKEDIGVILRAILDAFPGAGLLYHPRKAVDAGRIRKEVASAHRDDGRAAEIAQKISEWAAKAKDNSKKHRAAAH